MKILKACQIGLLAVIFFTLAGFLAGFHLMFDLTTQFRVQYYLLASFFLICFVIFQAWRWALLALLPILLNGIFILPLFAHVKETVPFGYRSTLRLVIANVEADNTHYAAVKKMVENSGADLVVLVETNDAWVRELESLKQFYPYYMLRGRSDCFGMSIFSRFPLQAEPAQLNPNGEIYLHAVDVLKGEKNFSLLAVHPPPPVSLERFATRNQAYEEIVRWVRSRKEPVIVAGDLNSAVWSPFYRRLEKKMGLSSIRAGRGVIPTWPAFVLDIFRVPLDHCFVSSDFKVSDVQTGKSNGSDHLPLIVDLKL